MSPSPTPEPLGLNLSFDLATTFVSQSTGGPGTTPPEASGFAAGTSLVEPNTPYDALSLAAQTPGNVGQAQGVVGARYVWSNIKANAIFGAGYVRGSSTNAAYWAEPLMPTLNPHLGQQGMPYALVFPTHAGQDDTTAFRGSLLYGDVAAANDAWRLRGGWFDLDQTDKFVFAPPLVTDAVPALGPTTQESLVPAYPNLDSWAQASQSLPLHGLDLILKQGLGIAELTDAVLPAPSGIGARLTMGSLVVDHGEGTRYSAQIAHIVSSGVYASSALYGASPTIDTSSAQGPLPESTLDGQQQTTAGVRAAFHVGSIFDSVIELGRSWYGAENVPAGGVTEGGFYHAVLSRTIRRATAAIEWFRFEPTYAPFGMAYGTDENFWTAAWAWSGFAFETGYQTVDNTIAANNRQGIRLRYNLDGGPLEMHLVFSHFDQIAPYAAPYAYDLGFTESEFSPQIGSGTLAWQGQLGAWVTWHAPWADVILDAIQDTIHRSPSPGETIEAFNMSVPQYVLTVARTFNPNLLATIGFARYAQFGSWAAVGTNNVDFFQRTWFVGVQWRESSHLASMLTVRRMIFSGAPYYFGAPIQNYQGWTMLFEQRFHY